MSEDFILAHGEEFVQCPYNPSHLITNVRILYHMTKCRSNYFATLSTKNVKESMVTCKYDFTHHCPKIELALHERFCPQRGNPSINMPFPPKPLISQMINKGETKSWNANAAGAEDWEAGATDGHRPGYDPSHKMETNLVLRMPHGLTKSEKTSFRRGLRERAAIAELKGKGINNNVNNLHAIGEGSSARKVISVNNADKRVNHQSPLNKNRDDSESDDMPRINNLSIREENEDNGNKNGDFIGAAGGLIISDRWSAVKCFEEDENEDDFSGIDPYGRNFE